VNPYVAVSPAHGPARSARNALEVVLLGIREIPARLDRPGVGDRLRRAIDSLYATIDSTIESPAHLDGLMEAGAAMSEAREILGRAEGDPAKIPALGRSLSILDDAIARLRPVAEQVAMLQLEKRLNLRAAAADEAPKPRPFRASVGLPELHSLARPPLPLQVLLDPIVPLESVGPAPKPPPKLTLEQLQAMAQAGAAGKPMKVPGLEEEEEAPDEPPPPLPVEFAYEPAIEEREVVRQLARFALEDLAGLSTLRHPIPTETWLDQAPFEQRLLNNLDYFASLGAPALAMVSLYHAEAEAPDAARAFATAFALGCIEGSDAACAAVATLKQSPPEEFPGWVEGWWLAPSPAIDESMVDLLDHPKAALAGVGVDVLAARVSLPGDAAQRVLARGEPELTKKVAGALGRCLLAQPALALLDPLARDEADDETLITVLQSMLRRGGARARDACRRHAMIASGRRRDGAATLLALAGYPDDVTTLLTVAGESPTPALVRAIGRFGHVDTVAPLIALLSAEAEEVVAAAAEALDRITGAGLRETIEEPWEVQLPPEAREMTNIPKPTRKVQRVVVDPARWTQWWEGARKRFDPRVKWRGGRPFSVMRIVEELEAKETPTERRDDAELELAIATGTTSGFSPHDWVKRQVRHLGELRDTVRSMAPAEGGWCFAGASVRNSLGATRG
jgi:hypothetical protein